MGAAKPGKTIEKCTSQKSHNEYKQKVTNSTSFTGTVNIIIKLNCANDATY